MIEHIECEGCGADTSTDMEACGFCEREFRHSERTLALLALRDKLEDLLSPLDYDQFKLFVRNSGYATHPIVIYRTAKADLIGIYCSGSFNHSDFCKVLDSVRSVTFGVDYYWNVFVNYFSEKLPFYFNGISIDDYDAVNLYLMQRGLDYDEKIKNWMKRQIVAEKLGVDFIKEYDFYLNSSNYLTDPAFLHKMDYLKNKFNKVLLTLN